MCLLLAELPGRPFGRGGRLGVGSYQNNTRIKRSANTRAALFSSGVFPCLPARWGHGFCSNAFTVALLRDDSGRASVSRNKGGQDRKGLWWMSWRQEPMKDVAWLR